MKGINMPTKPKSSTKPATKPTSPNKAKASDSQPKTKRGDRIVELLKRPEGVSVEELRAEFGTKPHTIRAQISIETRKRGNYELHVPTQVPDISLMVGELERLGAQKDGERLPLALARAWSNRTIRPVSSLVEELWLPYLSWVRRYLVAGSVGGGRDAERFLCEGMREFLSSI